MGPSKGPEAREPRQADRFHPDYKASGTSVDSLRDELWRSQQRRGVRRDGPGSTHAYHKHMVLGSSMMSYEPLVPALSDSGTPIAVRTGDQTKWNGNSTNFHDASSYAQELYGPRSYARHPGPTPEGGAPHLAHDPWPAEPMH